MNKLFTKTHNDSTKKVTLYVYLGVGAVIIILLAVMQLSGTWDDGKENASLFRWPVDKQEAASCGNIRVAESKEDVMDKTNYKQYIVTEETIKQAKKAGIPPKAFRRIGNRFLEEKVPREEWGDTWAHSIWQYDAFEGLLQLLEPADPAIKGLMEQAAQSAGEADFEQAERLLQEAVERLLAMANETNSPRQKLIKQASKLQEIRARLVMSDLRYSQGAGLFESAGELLRKTNGNDRVLMLESAALAWFVLGKARSDIPALERSISLRNTILDLYPRQKGPRFWAGIQVSIGTALRIIGEREPNKARLAEAIKAFKTALQVFTRKDRPVDWAVTQYEIGRVLKSMDGGGPNDPNLNAAAQTHRMALRECTRERAPAVWAMIRQALGDVLHELGEREAGGDRLEEAASAYRAVLPVYREEKLTIDWANTQRDLGNTLYTLGRRETGRTRLEEAVMAYQAAIQVYFGEKYPKQWALVQEKLGLALQALGERESGAARLEEAVAAFRAALQVYTREDIPLVWAVAHVSLGDTLTLLCKRSGNTGQAEQALECFQKALQVFDREKHPGKWARTHNLLGNTLAWLGEQETGTKRLREAMAAYQAALDVMRQHDDGKERLDELSKNMEHCRKVIAERS
jgi:tetratricopeptide (TPR) repeat protein